MDSVIYYFTGTGNSYKVSKDIAQKLGDTKLIRICSDNMHLCSQGNYKKVGIVFPVYYFSLPNMVRDFVKNLTLDSDAYVYAVATCGAFVGISFIQLKKILVKKGLLLSSIFKVTMPDNYQVLYSPLSLKKQYELINIAENKVENIVTIIQNNKIENLKEPNILLTLVGKLFSKTFKPKLKDRNFWVDEKCNGCGVCKNICPANDIIILDNKPKWQNNCEQCLACMQWCPQKSIQYKKNTVKRERYQHPQVSLKEMIINIK
jgi:ferredoxin/flavodoxin